jgi:perosamine synthetase
MIPVNRPLLSESDFNSVKEAFDSTQISGTSASVSIAESFLKEFLNVKHAILVSSGTSALDISVASINQKHNANVIVPSLTIMSTVNELVRRNFKIKIVDSDSTSWVSNSRSLASNVDKNSVAIIPTHIFGVSVDVEDLRLELQQYEIHIIEDAAQNFGVKNGNGKYYGTLGHVGVTSFYVNKNITTGEGGAIFTNCDEFARNADEFRNLGFSKSLPRFVHKKIGWNFRMPGMSAAMIATQASRIEKILERRDAINETYRQLLGDHPWFEYQEQDTYSSKDFNWVFPILLRREVNLTASELQDILSSAGVESRRFYCPLHLQPVLKGYTGITLCGDMKISENLWNKGLYLPSGVGTTDEEIQTVSSILWKLPKTTKLLPKLRK